MDGAARALLLACMLAGCASPEAPATAAPPPVTTVEGWVLDAALRPVANATVSVQGLGLAAAAVEGRFALALPRGVDLLLKVEAPGFAPASRLVPAGAGARVHLNVTLERLPSERPYVQVTDWQGFLQCAATVVAMEDPGRPHEHQGVRCSDAVPEDLDQNAWSYPVPAGASGLVLEVAWEPGTPLSRSLVLKLEAQATGEVLGFAEGPSILKMQVAASQLARLAQAGDATLRLTILPGAGAGSHEHGAVGAFVQQPFTIYATAFFHMPADPTYSIAGQG